MPAGISNSEFGQNIMKWGRGDTQARERISTLTREELEKGGVTQEIAKSWRDFYQQVTASNPGNPSAAGRMDLMQKAYELGGQMTGSRAGSTSHTEHINLHNRQAHDLRLIIEPWAQELDMPSGAAYDIVFEGPPNGSHRIEVGEREVVIYGWSGSIVSVSAKDTIIWDCRIPVPDAP